jgi:hypothetical protein
VTLTVITGTRCSVVMTDTILNSIGCKPLSSCLGTSTGALFGRFFSSKGGTNGSRTTLAPSTPPPFGSQFTTEVDSFPLAETRFLMLPQTMEVPLTPVLQNPTPQTTPPEILPPGPYHLQLRLSAITSWDHFGLSPRRLNYDSVM